MICYVILNFESDENPFPMKIVITEWGLDSYLDLLGNHVFDRSDYTQVLRPDVKRLLNYPGDPKFGVSTFWGPAESPRGIVADGFKMKWHNLGPGRVQLRLCVAIVGGI